MIQMTTEDENGLSGQAANVANGVMYAIDETAYEIAGESYLFKVWQRLCWSGECRLCRRFPAGKPIMPGRTTKNSIYNAAKVCPSKVQFVTPGMSLLEAVFRGLVANGNRPMRFDEIVQFLQDSWETEFPQRVESVESLQRVLDGPNEYRISRV